MERQDLRDEIIHLAALVAEANQRRFWAERKNAGPAGTASRDLERAQDYVSSALSILGTANTDDPDDMRAAIEHAVKELSRGQSMLDSGIGEHDALIENYEDLRAAFDELAEHISDLAETMRARPAFYDLIVEDGSYHVLDNLLLGADAEHWERTIRALIPTQPVTALHLLTDFECPEFTARLELAREAAAKAMEDVPGTFLAWIRNTSTFGNLKDPADFGLDEATCHRLLDRAIEDAPTAMVRLFQEPPDWWPALSTEQALTLLKALLREPRTSLVFKAVNDLLGTGLIAPEQIPADEWPGLYRLNLEHAPAALRRFLEKWPPPEGARLNAEDVRAVLAMDGLNGEDRVFFIARLVPLADGQPIDADPERQEAPATQPVRRPS